MAEKTLKTRIKLKYDTYQNWTTNNPVLKQGEMAVTTITTGSTQTVNSVTPPQVLLKVGDGEHAYNSLPWASGLAADVYSWAKAATKPNYAYSEITGTPTIGNGTITVTQNGSQVGSFTLNQTGNTTIALTDTIITDTNTQYQLITSGTTLKLQSREGTSGSWADVTGQSFDLATILANSFDSKGSAAAVLGKESDSASMNTVYGAKAAATAAQNTANGKYTKPAAGIPKADLVSDVQTSLGKADTAVQSITTGSDNGTISVDGSDVAVKGLGTAAYKADTYFATQAAYSATASQVATNTQDISDLKETVTGGMHFKGKFDSLPAVTSYSAGDFVIVGTKEYILYVDNSSKKSWVELGDEGSHLTKVQADGYYVTKNSDITSGTHTKITYDTKGLVTKGEDLTATDIPNLPASKITSGTFSDDRIASASVWNAKQNALTAEQLAAANSGITAEKVTKYDGYADTLAGKQETLTPTQLEAVNSGITSTKVTTYDGYASKISTLESKPGLDKTGTVTSVGVSTTANGGLKVTGSPITSSGTINIDIDDAVTFVFDCGSSSTNI